MAIAKYSLVALDCPDPEELARFYQQIAGGEVEVSTGSDDWVELQMEGATIAFQQVDDFRPPEWPDGSPQQAHLDFDTPDLDEGEKAVLAIGARKTEFQPQPDHWRVFLDPVGHPFCLVKA